MSDTVGSNTNGLPDPENDIFELDIFELGISFLSCLQAEICVLPVWVADILYFRFGWPPSCFSDFRLHGTLFAIALLKTLTNFSWI